MNDHSRLQALWASYGTVDPDSNTPESQIAWLLRRPMAKEGIVEAAITVQALANLVNAMAFDPALQLIAKLLQETSVVAGYLMRGHDAKALAHIKSHFDHTVIVPAFEAACTALETDESDAAKKRIDKIENVAVALVINTAGTAYALTPKAAVYDAMQKFPLVLPSDALDYVAVAALIQRVTQRAELAR